MKGTERRHEDVLERGWWRHLHRARVGRILAEVARVSTAERPPRLLDVGCGDGVITRRLRQQFPAAVIDAVDLDPARLDRAREAAPGVAFRQGDVTALPYAKASFDLVLCHHVMEHVVDDEAVLRECSRVLAPEGVLVLGIPHEDGLAGRMLRRLHSRMYADGQHVNFYTIPGMAARLRTHGFADVQLETFGLLWPQYHVHALCTAWKPTFALGHWISQRLAGTADSLIFIATRHGAEERGGVGVQQRAGHVVASD